MSTKRRGRLKIEKWKGLKTSTYRIPHMPFFSVSSSLHAAMSCRAVLKPSASMESHISFVGLFAAQKLNHTNIYINIYMNVHRVLISYCLSSFHFLVLLQNQTCHSTATHDETQNNHSMAPLEET